MIKKKIVGVVMPDGKKILAFCGLQIRNLNYKQATVTDTCDKLATSYFVTDTGRKLYRCDEHRGKKREHRPNMSL